MCYQMIKLNARFFFALNWDWYGDYSSEAQTDPMGASSGSLRVVRGGSWVDSTGFVRSASRGYNYGPRDRAYGVGFRLARP